MILGNHAIAHRVVHALRSIGIPERMRIADATGAIVESTRIDVEASDPFALEDRASEWLITALQRRHPADFTRWRRSGSDAFKALALALRQAVAKDGGSEVPSTKGVLTKN